MGAPMALNIAKRGHRLTVYNRTPDKARAVVEAGATLAKTPHDIGDVDVLMTCVADGAAEDAIFFGHGLIDQLPKSCVHVSCTTMGIDSARKLTAEHGKRGRAFVAAPVLGRAVDMAPAGKLFVIAAGPAEALKRCAPLFEAVGQRTFEFGAEPERAIAVKLAVNFMGLTNIEGMAEAFALTGQYGVQKSAFYEFITSTLFGTPLYKSYGKLIEQDKVQILLSPLSGDEGIAVKNFAKTHPELTFVNAASGAQETTYVDPAPNFFRYNMDGAQWQVGLGKYAYETKGYRKIATVGEDYSFIYTQVFGLVLEFCGAGGKVTNRQWVPLGTKDFASVIAALPDDVDAIYLGLGGADAVNFLNQYQQAGGKAHLLGGSIMVDQTIMSAKGDAKKALTGTIAASGQADTWEDPGWQAFVKSYQAAFPPEKRFPSPSLLATNYYGSTMALILALQKVNGDLSDNQSKFKAALASLEIDAPNGKIKLDANRQAIGTNFVTEVVDDGKGALFSKVVKVIPNVNQTLGYDPAVFAKIGLPSRTVPECKKY